MNIIEQMLGSGSGVLPEGIRQQLTDSYDYRDDIEKALTTGSGIITDGTTGGGALREQWLDDALRTLSYEQKDAFFMSKVPHKKAQGVIEEYTTWDQYGSAGDGFTLETGDDGNFGGTAVDDSFTRRTRTIKFMATVRQVGTVAQKVRNIADPMATAEKGGILELIGKANLACYFGDSKTSVAQYDGIVRQINDWVTLKPECADILLDAGGAVVDSDVIADSVAISLEHWGNPSLLIQSIRGAQDTQKALFPALRGGLGDIGAFGVDKKTFKSDNGPIALASDKMLRVNRPNFLGGSAITGKPRSSADAGSIAWSATPWSACAAAAAGTGNYWQNVTTNDQTSAASAPAVPTKLGRNNAANRLSYANHYYAASIVYKGREGLAWVYGAASANTVASATAVATSSSSPIVSMTFDYTKVPNLGTTYPRNMTKIRVYRCDTVPNSMNDFDFLFEVGFQTSAANPTAFDNGYNMPGTDEAFLITENKNGADAWMFLELLSILKVPLPRYLMAEQFGLLLFGTPWFPVPAFNVHIRNIGALT
jgi:hypothetical protein